MSELHPEYKDLADFLTEFNSESDRGAVLTAGSYLDERLGEIISAFLIEGSDATELIEGFNAPLGTFSSRIKAAHAMGLIQQNEYEELNTIRKVRNEFGHSWKGVSFKSQKIKDLCNNLPWLGPVELESSSNERARFNFAVAILLIDFMWRVRLVKQERRTLKKWSNAARS